MLRQRKVHRSSKEVQGKNLQGAATNMERNYMRQLQGVGSTLNGGKLSNIRVPGETYHGGESV